VLIKSGMLIDMVSKVQFEIYHGEVTVVYGPNGIILHGFKCIKNRTIKLAEQIFQSVHQWLEHGFHINSETYM
jgi:hypothetical protein